MKRGLIFALGICTVAIWFVLQRDLAAQTAVAQDRPCLATILVRGPDGQPLLTTDVHVYMRVPYDQFNGPGNADAVLRTDALGECTMHATEGIRMFFVCVPGVGYSASGLTELDPQETSRPTLPPLAPYAKIHGFISDAIMQRAPGGKIVVEADENWCGDESPIDATGQYQLNNVVAGKVRITLHTVANKPVAQATLDIVPGEVLDLPQFGTRGMPGEIPRNLKPEATLNIDPKAIPATGDGQTVAGFTTDETGAPIARVTINSLIPLVLRAPGRNDFAVGQTYSATDGHFTLLFRNTQPSTLRHQSAIIGFQPDHPPVITYLNSNVIGADRTTQINLVMPSTGGRIKIKLLQDGNPLPNTWVRLFPTFIGDIFDYDGERPYLAALAPGAQTDGNGVALIDNILPGIYDVYGGGSVNGKKVGMAFREWLFAGRPRICIARGDNQDFRLNLRKFDSTFATQVLGSDGNPSAGLDVAMHMAIPGVSFTTAGRLTSSTGELKTQLQNAGVWHIAGRTTGDRASNLQFNELPSKGADFYIAATPLIVRTQPIQLALFDHAAGSITCQLLDADGNPAKGSAQITWDQNPRKLIEFAGSADEQGEIRFEGVAPGRFIVNAFIPNNIPVPSIAYLPPTFAVDPLNLSTWVYRPQRVQIGPDDHLTLKFQQTHMGYLRGTVKIPPGQNPNEYFLEQAGPPDPDSPAQIRYIWNTGKFIYGPAYPGKVKLRVLQSPTGDTRNNSASAGEFEANIEPGKVVDAEFQAVLPEVPAVPPAAQSRFFDVSGKVFLEDGRTPAYGAVVQLFNGHAVRPYDMQMTDAAGTIPDTPIDRLGINLQGAPVTVGPMAVVSIPGSYGAKIIPLNTDQPNRLNVTLDKPIALKGRVTVGGNSPPAAALCRVVATFQGDEQLSNLCSFEIMTDADGNFVLGGMTRGVYKVQADLDGIWTSPTDTIQVTDQPLAPVVMQIPALGQPVRLRFQTPEHRPLIGATIKVPVPEGPVSDKVWPTSFKTDGMGIVQLEGLTAGTHSATVIECPGTFDFEVPPLTSDVPQAIDITVKPPD